MDFSPAIWFEVEYTLQYIIQSSNINDIVQQFSVLSPHAQRAIEFLIANPRLSDGVLKSVFGTQQYLPHVEQLLVQLLHEHGDVIIHQLILDDVYVRAAYFGYEHIVAYVLDERNGPRANINAHAGAAVILALEEQQFHVVSYIMTRPHAVQFNAEYVRILELRQCNLYEIPPYVFLFTALEHLDVSNNHIISIPPNIAALSQLKYLNCNYNNLRSLPAALGELQQLRELYVNDNRLTTLPRELGFMRSLKIIHAKNNDIQHVPDEVYRLYETQGTEIDVSGKLKRKIWQTGGKCHLSQ